MIHPRRALSDCLCWLVLVYALHLASVRAQFNVTVNAQDSTLQYEPADAWETITDQVIGDGTAQVTRIKGAKVSLSFSGTGIYFQTTRAQRRGISTVNLDGNDFEIDSSLSRNVENLGVLWAILSLKDEKHMITVTQSADDGVELAVNAFVYLTSNLPAPSPSATLQPNPIPGLLDPTNTHFARNTALIVIGVALVFFLLGAIACIMRKRKRKAAIVKASIRLAMSPTSPSWMSKSLTCNQAPSYRTGTSSVLQTPSSAAFLLRHSHQDSVQSIDQVLTPVKQIPREDLVRNTSLTASTPQRPRFVLPRFTMDQQSSRSSSARTTFASVESASLMITTTSASSDLDHESVDSVSDMITDLDITSMLVPEPPRASFSLEQAHSNHSFSRFA